jgi:hypothetical protein
VCMRMPHSVLDVHSHAEHCHLLGWSVIGTRVDVGGELQSSNAAAVVVGLVPAVEGAAACAAAATVL